VLLYGDSPASGEPTLELFRKAVPVDADVAANASAHLARALQRWGWEATVDAANGCATAVIDTVVEAGADSLELFAFRRAHQLNVEVHFSGTATRIHQLLPTDARLARIELLTDLWGVRPLGDGEAVWFEFHLPS
jgi:hypothetical protein